MSDKRGNSTKIRRRCFEYWRRDTPHGWRMDCASCGREIHPATMEWNADHLVVHAHGGSDDPPNVRPLCAGKGGCHAAKTKQDVSFIAKGKRVSDRTYGVRRASSNLAKPEGMTWNWGRRRYMREGEELD